MSELDELYQSVILAHDRSPRNFRELSGEGCRAAEGYNPLCGDRFRVMVRLEGDRIADVGFQGAGCAISKASASLMTEAIRGKSVAEARDLFDRFLGMVRQRPAPETDPAVDPPAGEPPAPVPAKLRVFSGVTKYPMRVKCATLAWHAMKQAVDDPDADRVPDANLS